jgi:hypothetical protein
MLLGEALGGGKILVEGFDEIIRLRLGYRREAAQS